LDSVELELPLGCLFLSDAFGLDHLLTISNSILLPFASLFFLSFFPDLPCLISEFFKLGSGLLRCEFGLVLLLASDEDFLLKVRVVLVLLDPILCHLDAAVAYFTYRYL
jgi:hypothetical protein